MTYNTAAGGGSGVVSAQNLYNYAAPYATSYVESMTNGFVTITPQFSNHYSFPLYFKTVQLRVDFANDLPEYGSGGSVTVYGSQVSSPTYDVVAVSNKITAAPVTPQTFNNLTHDFKCWTNNLNSDTIWDYSVSLAPNAATTYTLRFTMKPEAVTNFHSEGDPGDQVTLCWTDNPNQYVSQYEIRRSWNKNQPYITVGTVNSGVQTWVDEACELTGSYTDSLVHYQVIAKYSHNGVNANSDPRTTSIYGKESYEAKARDGVPKFVGMHPTPGQYSIGNYPNPFNPTTMIVYSLVEDSEVQLEVFDLSGRLITSLVNGHRTKGEHATAWRAIDKSGKSVAGGTYIYRIVARPNSGSKPFVTSGKLLLLK